MYSNIGTIGRDAELRYLQNGTAVANVSVSVNYGRKGQDGRRPTQWLRLALWGRQAEGLTPYLTKGTKIFFSADDVHVETFQSNSGETKYNLIGNVRQIEFAGGGQSRQQTPRPQQQAKSTQQQDDFDDSSIPF